MGITSMTAFLTLVGKPRRDCDFCDKLNHRYASYFLIALGLMFFAREYMGHPIDCFAKGEWPSSWAQYARDYCLVEGTYFIPLNETVPQFKYIEDYSKVQFYQWLPFTFCFLGLLMTLPRRFWDVVNWSSTFQMSSILHNIDNKQVHCPRKFAKSVTCHIKDVLRRKGRLLNQGSWGKIRNLPYLSIGYIAVKVLNIFITCIVFFLLTYFVADDHTHVFGVPIIMNLLKGVRWRETGVFPRVTFCIFDVRKLHSNNSESDTVSVQCVLTANMLTEVFYIVSYLTLVLVQLFNLYSVVSYCSQLGSRSRSDFIEDLVEESVDLVWPPLQSDPKFKEIEKKKQHEKDEMEKYLNTVISTGDDAAVEKAKKERETMLEAYEDDSVVRTVKRDSKRELYMKRIDYYVTDFVEYLGPDVTLLLRLLSINSNRAVAGALAGRLFWKYCKDKGNSISPGADKNNNEP
ncbi:hypothetical protein FO519_003256 [Halicephalobus sp. NKZ332]|nr:hypothetical protein FO519_003256 [Halicephalobus sp. NKZ332]